MPALTPEARQKLAAYLRFQQELGLERVRIAPDLGAAAAPAPMAAAAAAPAPVAAAVAARPAGESLEAIQTDLGPDCRRCKLHQERHRIVFGEGDAQAELVFVGEGPGADEDAQGRPFVGRGGQLLNDMIQKGMGLRREQVYICNVVKCRPPGNRTPEAEECAACSPFLLRQLRAIRPRMVCALGATAAQALRPYKGALASVRGVIHPLRLEEFETRLVVTYHPAYLLRDPSQKREAWKDLQLIMDFLGLR
ncbi:MAG TPA: uracil-DNA glycosylase [Terriglobales bacterium]|nr:uracil-DNA glycosylase [Terriglobales bacterium]